MPNCVTHFLQAKHVLDGLDKKQDINSHAFFWGAQGPDFFFAHRYLPWMKGESLKDYGSRLHASPPSALLGHMRDYAMDNILAFSYALGFVCHYSLDSIAHPYVNMLAAELLEDRPTENLTSLHAEIESSLDTIMLRRETGKLSTQVRQSKLFPRDEEVQREIARLYHFVFQKLFVEELPNELIYQATVDCQKVFSLLTDSTTMKRKIMSRVERGRPHIITGHILPLVEDPSIDFANVGQSSWDNNGVQDDRDFFQLYDSSIDLALEINSNYKGCDFANVTGERMMG